MTLDVQALATKMLDAVRTDVSARWPKLRAFAEIEMRKLAQNLVDVQALLVAGEIDPQRARQLMQMQQNAARSVLCTIQGLGLLTAEEATTAAIRAVADEVNAALKFKLL